MVNVFLPVIPVQTYIIVENLQLARLKYMVLNTNHNYVFDYDNWYSKFYKKTLLSDHSYGKNALKVDKIPFKVST